MHATGGGACRLAMSAEAVSADAAAVAAEIAVAVVVEIAAERTVEGTKARLKTWYGSERPCVGERKWARVESLGDLRGEEHKEGKKRRRR